MRAYQPSGKLTDALAGSGIASPAPLDSAPYSELVNYLRAGGSWTGSDAQLNAKAAGLAKLIVGSSEYQFV